MSHHNNELPFKLIAKAQGGGGGDWFVVCRRRPFKINHLAIVPVECTDCFIQSCLMYLKISSKFVPDLRKALDNPTIEPLPFC